jgi:hypothetical protein
LPVGNDGLWCFMKRSDTAPDTISGKFVAGARPLNTVTEGIVLRRAKEIAVINGREGNDYTQEDYEQARQELTGFPIEDSGDAEKAAPSVGTWGVEPVDEGHKAPVRPAPDEDILAENLVKEGVQEATHHQMLAGSQMKKERDLE